MKMPKWLRRMIGPPEPTPVTVMPEVPGPLREFIYLDEVSLRSLLSSQRGEVVDTTSEQSVAGDQIEFGSAAGFNTAMLAKGEMTSRYQTSNSSTLQTSRKATVQSWFRDFHALPGLRIIEPVTGVAAVDTISDLLATEHRSILLPAADLARGDLAEFRVQLTADPVFRFGTLMTEFSGIADDHPVLFAANNGFSLLAEMEPTNRILQRLLAGLIPVRARMLDYLAVTIDGVEYLAHREALVGLALETREIEIVGVTEHLAYWKDIRRVLFSEAEFTMLCRVSIGALHETWSPVKLAALFVPFAPDLVEQINIASRSSIEGSGGVSINANDLALGEALHSYRDALLLATSTELSEDQERVVEEAILRLRDRSGSVSQQRSAFRMLHNLLHSLTALTVDAKLDLELRDRAREAAGLSLFPSLTSGMTTIVGSTPAVPQAQTSRLLNVEVVAIYW